MIRQKRYLIVLLALMTVLTACHQRGNSQAGRDESAEAKELLQGIWMDDATEDVVFRMKGDSVYYPDSTSMPAYFKVVGDMLYIGTNASYHIEKHTEHLFWFTGTDGNIVKLVKKDDADEQVFADNTAQVQQYTHVIKRDTVTIYNGHRYHLYIAINPTRYKVVRHTLNADGLDVENVYFDNIIHLSIFEGNREIFSRDFRKQLYQKGVPAQFYSQSVLNDMTFDSVGADGFHVNVSLCTPGDASCYLMEHVISFQGTMSTQLLEY